MALRVLSSRALSALASPRCAPLSASLSHFRFLSTLPMYTLEYVKVETAGTDGRVGVVILDRPKALNALCTPLMDDLITALRHFQEEPNVGCMVITGNKKAFAAGADIKEMQHTSFANNFRTDFLGSWTQILEIGKPIIAAVNGFALGGGCELAMMCDIIYAGENAKFGQPEINLGTIPGAGGSQRLPRAIGKSRAMEMNLSGQMITAQEADKWGLVSRVFPTDKVVEEAIKTADVIAGKSKIAVHICKQATNAAYESSLTEGLRTEKRLFHATFATHDRKEGMTAFVEKRPAKWEDE